MLLGQLLLIEAGVLFVAVYLALWRRAPRPLVGVQVLSAVLALGGAVVPSVDVAVQHLPLAVRGARLLPSGPNSLTWRWVPVPIPNCSGWPGR